MKYNILGYLIGEGFSNVFKNKKSTGASLVIMCATMIIFGVFLILGENINHFVDNLKADQGFSVFIKVDATQEEIDKVGEEIRAIDGVNTVDFVSKDDALNIMRERLKDTKGVLDGFDKKLLKTSTNPILTRRAWCIRICLLPNNLWRGEGEESYEKRLWDVDPHPIPQAEKAHGCQCAQPGDHRGAKPHYALHPCQVRRRARVPAGCGKGV